MPNRKPFIKGYKIDLDKAKQNYDFKETDPNYARFIVMWKTFPEPYLYFATIMEANNQFTRVMVLADGYDKEALEQEDMVELSEPYTNIFTPGTWEAF